MSTQPPTLLALCAAATPGPWIADKDGFIRASKHKTNIAVDTRMAMGTNVAYITGNHAPKYHKPCKALPVEPELSANGQLIGRASPETLSAAYQALQSARKALHKIAPTACNGSIARIDQALRLLDGQPP